MVKSYLHRIVVVIHISWICAPRVPGFDGNFPKNLSNKHIFAANEAHGRWSIEFRHVTLPFLLLHHLSSSKLLCRTIASASIYWCVWSLYVLMIHAERWWTRRVDFETFRNFLNRFMRSTIVLPRRLSLWWRRYLFAGIKNKLLTPHFVYAFCCMQSYSRNNSSFFDVFPKRTKAFKSVNDA